ncbi:MAG TPA: energy transducer TonB [Rhodanobacteraceae bacterium]|jgi:protein TonB|nr:energy transducer TonB [Rhodanobacteraceae bacterium]
MITFDSSRNEPASARHFGAMRGLGVAVGMALLLAGCGKGEGPVSSAPVASVKPAASAPASTAPAELPAATPSSASSAAEAQAAAQAKAKLSSMSVTELLSAARDAYAQHRLVAPAGDNAMEYYEAVLAKDPKNQVAKDALRETFPFGVPDVEKAISQNNFVDANREIDVLSKADPTNYTLTLLRSKLDAQQKLQARQQQEAQQKAQRAAELATAQQTAAAKAAADKEAAAKLAAQQAVQQAAAAKAAPPPKPAAATAAPKAAGVTRGAQMVKAAAAQYPLAAARNQTSGYAVVEFTVTSTGSVTSAHVVESSPRRVFDQAAIRAVEQSTYKPALKDGDPVSAVLQRRVDFKFGG